VAIEHLEAQYMPPLSPLCHFSPFPPFPPHAAPFHDIYLAVLFSHTHAVKPFNEEKRPHYNLSKVNASYRQLTVY
jgi:hypothetical protein